MSHADNTRTRLCDRCLKEIPEGRGKFFEVRVEIVSDPTIQELDDEPTPGNIRSQIRELAIELEQIGPTDAMEQVYRRRVWTLCNPCLDLWLEAPFGKD